MVTPSAKTEHHNSEVDWGQQCGREKWWETGFARKRKTLDSKKKQCFPLALLFFSTVYL